MRGEGRVVGSPPTPSSGRTIASLEVRTVTDALVVAVRREGVLLENPDPRKPLTPGDIIYLAGSGTAVRKAMELLSSGPEENTDAT